MKGVNSGRACANGIEFTSAVDVRDNLVASLNYTYTNSLVLATRHPIPREPGQKLHVLFCLTKPSASVLEHATPADPLVIGKKELYWGPEGRMTDSEIDLKAIEKLIGPTTMRTKDTVDQIAARFFSA